MKSVFEEIYVGETLRHLQNYFEMEYTIVHGGEAGNVVIDLLRYTM
jgi:hypothetical protein